MKTKQTNRLMQPAPRPWRLLAAVVGLTAVLAACGGGGSASVGSGGTGFSGPISGFGSVIVNGVRIDDSSAVVTLDDNVSGSSGDLKLGMVVEIEGSRSADGSTGKADTIGSHSIVQGPVTSVTATQLTVLGLSVTVAPSTVFAGGAGSLADLAVGAMVDIHGIVSAADELTATRIESKPGATDVRLTGPVKNLSGAATTFTLHGTTVNYAAATGNNLPANLANDVTVRVRGTLATAPAAVPATINATRVQLRNLDRLKQNGHGLELEGGVTAFTSASSFVVNGTPVSVAGNASVSGTVVLGARVEVKGTIDASGTLVASRVEVKDDRQEDAQNNELHGLITAVDAVAHTFALRGVTVTWDASTTFSRLSAAGLVAGAKVEVKGKVTGSTVLASAIKLED